MPKPGTLVELSPKYNPAIVTGIKVFPDNPFQFEFIIDKGDSKLSGEELTQETQKMAKYFLAALTVPEKDLWVNLSPYEKNRIIPEAFGVTGMGRDLLAEDYILKQLSASLTKPDTELGKKYWDMVNKLTADAGQRTLDENTTNLSPTTNDQSPASLLKIWITPDKAVVYENNKEGVAFIVNSRLKVMLEEDYIKTLDAGRQTLEKTTTASDPRPESNVSRTIREVIIPELTKEVNENTHFSQLRQIYNAYILAIWYKQKIKNSIINQYYSDKNKIDGINIDDPQEKQKIYEQYLEAFKKGVYSTIREDYDETTGETVPRKYFSGGVDLTGGDNTWRPDIVTTTDKTLLSNSSSSVLFTAMIVALPVNIGNFIISDFSYNVSFILLKIFRIKTSVKDPPEVKLIQNELDLTQRQAKQLWLIFKSQERSINRAFNKGKDRSQRQKVKVVANPDSVIRVSHAIHGVRFSAQLENPDGSAVRNPDGTIKEIAQVKITKDESNTLVPYGLVSNDYSDEKKKVPINYPDTQFDHDEATTKLHYNEISTILARKIGDAALEGLSQIDLGLPKYTSLIEKLLGKELYREVRENPDVQTGKSTFNEKLGEALGGKDYRNISVIVKILGRAASGKDLEHLEAAEFNGETPLEDILRILDNLPHSLSPSQQYPPNPAIHHSLSVIAIMLHFFAKWNKFQFKLENAVPDGLQNWLFYSSFGYEMAIAQDPRDRSPDEEFIAKCVAEYDELVINGMRPNAASWYLINKYHKHLLAPMRSIPLREHPQIIKLINKQFEIQRKKLQKLYPDQKLSLVVQSNFTADGFAGYRFSIVLPNKTPIISIKVSEHGDTFTYSRPVIGTPLPKDAEAAVLVARDVAFDNNGLSSQEARKEFDQIFRSELANKYDDLAGVDFSSGQDYQLTIKKVLGNKQYDEDMIEFSAESASKSVSFNEFINSKLTRGQTEGYPLSIAIKLLAYASVGLNRKQITDIIRANPTHTLMFDSLLFAKRINNPDERHPIPSEIIDATNSLLAKIISLARNNIGLKEIVMESRGYPIRFQRPKLESRSELTLQANDVAGLRRTPAQSDVWNTFKISPGSLIRDMNDPEYYFTPIEGNPYQKASSSSTVGGIDFNPSQLNLITENNNGSIEFHIDPGFIKAFEESDGLTPNVGAINTLMDLKTYLGSPAVPNGR